MPRELLALPEHAIKVQIQASWPQYCMVKGWLESGHPYFVDGDILSFSKDCRSFIISATEPLDMTPHVAFDITGSDIEYVWQEGQCVMLHTPDRQCAAAIAKAARLARGERTDCLTLRTWEKQS